MYMYLSRNKESTKVDLFYIVMCKLWRMFGGKGANLLYSCHVEPLQAQDDNEYMSSTGEFDEITTACTLTMGLSKVSLLTTACMH